MEIISRTIEYKSRKDNFLIYPIGDIHAGSIHCAEQEIQQKVREIKETKNAYWLGMGDYADCILKDDKRFDIGGLAPWVKADNILRCQSDWIKDLFSPIKGKCLGLITGNHEESIHSKYQEDFTRNLCTDLGVSYGGYACYVLLRFQRTTGETKTSQTYKIHAWHGAGAAQTEGARLMRLMRLVNDFTAHIYLMGHLHAMTQHTPDRIDCIGERLKSVKLAATITGSWLRAYTYSKDSVNPSYAEIKGYKPSRIGCPIIRIHPDHDTFIIES